MVILGYQTGWQTECIILGFLSVNVWYQCHFSFPVGWLCRGRKWWQNSGRLPQEILQQGLHNGACLLQYPQNVRLVMMRGSSILSSGGLFVCHWRFCSSLRYFQAGGSPEHVIQLLSENYSAVAQTVNLLAEWLIQMGMYSWHFHYKMWVECFLWARFNLWVSIVCVSGVEPAQVQERVENHLKSLLIKHFDPQKADSIFTVEGEVRPGDSTINLNNIVIL